MAKGRDTVLQEILDECLSDNGLFLLESYARDGYTLQDMADKLGIQYEVFLRWRKKFPQIDEAIKSGKELTDYKVENALLKCALGYKTKEVKTTTIMRYGKVVETQVEELEKEQAPNVQAITLWLTNRNKDKWKTPNSKNLLDEVEEDTSIQVTVTRAGKHETDNGEDEDVVNEAVEITKAEPATAQPQSVDDGYIDEEEASEWLDEETTDEDWDSVIDEYGE